MWNSEWIFSICVSTLTYNKHSCPKKQDKYKVKIKRISNPTELCHRLTMSQIILLNYNFAPSRTDIKIHVNYRAIVYPFPQSKVNFYFYKVLVCESNQSINEISPFGSWDSHSAKNINNKFRGIQTPLNYATN